MASPISYQVAIPQLATLQARFKEAPEITAAAVTQAVNRSLVGYQATAKQLAPVDTGLLRNSIQIEAAKRSGSVFSGSVGTSTAYSVFQEEGTGLYGPNHALITARDGGYLTFRVKGRWVRVKSVAGSKPRWYMRGAVEANQAQTDAYFHQALEEIAARLAA